MSGSVIAGGALQRFARKAAEAADAAAEKCDLCSECIPPEHRHLFESETRSVACVCQACALLFSQPAASLGRHRLIPNRFLLLTDLEMTDSEWESLRVPVGLCFITGNGAYFPGPMGPTEGALDVSRWSSLRSRYPVLSEIEPDLEALLINRARGAKEYFIVPIDACFALVGLIRTNWRGLSGGKVVWAELEGFLDKLRRRCRVFSCATEVTRCQSATT